MKTSNRILLNALTISALAGSVAACESKQGATEYSGVSEEKAVEKRAELRDDVEGAGVKGEGLTAKTEAYQNELRNDAVQMNRDAVIKGMKRDLEMVDDRIEEMKDSETEKKRLETMAESTEDLLESLDKKYGEFKAKPDATFDRDIKQAQAALQNLKKEVKMDAAMKPTPKKKTM